MNSAKYIAPLIATLALVTPAISSDLIIPSYIPPCQGAGWTVCRNHYLTASQPTTTLFGNKIQSPYNTIASYVVSTPTSRIPWLYWNGYFYAGGQNSGLPPFEFYFPRATNATYTNYVITIKPAGNGATVVTFDADGTHKLARLGCAIEFTNNFQLGEFYFTKPGNEYRTHISFKQGAR